MALLEGLVVLAIALLLIALLWPIVSRDTREAGRRSQTRNDLKMIGLALHNYHDAYGVFPPAVLKNDQGTVLHSWRTLILPYLDQAPLYQKIDLSKPYNDPVNAEAYRARHGFPEGATPEDPQSLQTPWNETIKSLRLEREAKQAKEAAEFAAFMARTRPGIVLPK